jgi:ABC-type nickel/cobalt efflux system permease component RcnA
MRKRIYEMTIVLLLTAGLISPAVGFPFQQIGWQDLIKKVEFDDPFLALTPDQLSDLSLVAWIRELQARGRNVGEVTQKDVETAVQRLEAAQIDIDGLLARRAEIRELRAQRARAVVDDLDGRQVSMPGYALPLEYSGTKITEFLLVPWVGACIHTPPPPPNQIVYVKSKNGFEIKGRFSPVVVKGQMSVKTAQKDLYLVDGSRDIEVAYTMTTDAITDYSASESGLLAQVAIPESIGTEHSWVQKWQARTALLFTKAMTDIQQARSSGPMLWGLLVAFLYGILHTLGPGHGKTVVVAYFVGERGTLWRGLRMGGQIALFHVLSAVIVVVLTDYAVRQATGQAPSDYRLVRLLSYGSIIAIGLWMLLKAVKAVRPSYDHHHPHHGACGCAHHATPAKGISSMLSVAVGAVPCTGALLVLLFGLANDLLWPSIALVIAISLGMALALSGAGIAAILGRRFLDRRVGTDEVRQHRMATTWRIGAATGVCFFGFVLFAGSWP